MRNLNLYFNLLTMETIIVLCLLIIIYLLLQDKIVIRKRVKPKPPEEKINPHLPDIMGQPKPIKRQAVPNSTSERHQEEDEINPANLDIEYDDNEIVPIQIPQEEPEEGFAELPDLDEEEEEWNRYGTGIADDNEGYATGVTFDELTTVGMLLQNDSLQPSQKETAATIVQKIEGTELFDLLENSIENASYKIAMLLDRSIAAGSDTGSSILRKTNEDDFDIGEFV